MSGRGTAASPFRVTTVADAGGTGLRVTNVDTYVAGQEAYRTAVTLENRGGAPLTGVLYRAGDCYLQESDTGYGRRRGAPAPRAARCNANNARPVASSSGSRPGRRRVHGGGLQRGVAVHRHAQPFPNTCRCTEAVDNGAGHQLELLELAPGARATYAHFTVFSPTGVAGPPRAPAPPGAGRAHGRRPRSARAASSSRPRTAAAARGATSASACATRAEPDRRRDRKRQRTARGDAPPGAGVAAPRRLRGCQRRTPSRTASAGALGRPVRGRRRYRMRRAGTARAVPLRRPAAVLTQRAACASPASRTDAVEPGVEPRERGHGG